MSSTILNSESFDRAAHGLRHAIENERASSAIAEAADVMRRSAESFAEQVSRLARIEGMKAENAMRLHRGESPAYTEGAFCNV